MTLYGVVYINNSPIIISSEEKYSINGFYDLLFFTQKIVGLVS